MLIYKKTSRTKNSIITDYDTNIKGKVAIKIPVPQWSQAYRWGEYHFALGIKKYFERKGWKVVIQIEPEWYLNIDQSFDVVIVIRGYKQYIPNKRHLNIMWNICHSDMVSIKEYNNYDHVFVASEIWAKHLSDLCNVEVEPLLQCTDPELFYPNENTEIDHKLLFVGNSRGVYRRIVRDVLLIKRDLAIYGDNWNRFVSRKYLKARYIPNKELRRLYSSCQILLNDHWEDMREKGFLSNRLFDGFASGTFIISDNIKGGKKVFDDALVTYETKEELDGLIEEYINNDDLRRKKARKGYEIVSKEHTFEKRVDRIIAVIEKRN